MNPKKDPFVVAAFLASATLALVLPNFAFAQNVAKSNSTSSSTVRRHKQISPGNGWALTSDFPDRSAPCQSCFNERLYWTSNAGQTWRDITPPRATTQELSIIFFLDASHGWVVRVDPNVDGYDSEGNVIDCGTHLFVTRNGGKSWKDILVRSPHVSNKSSGSTMVLSEIDFVDSRHGWARWSWAEMHSYSNALLESTDGGHTWKRLPDPPGGGPMDFASVKHGWIIGEPKVPEIGVHFPDHNTLWATDDGGKSWRSIPLPVPMEAPAPNDSNQRTLSLESLKRKSESEGMLTGSVCLSDGTGQCQQFGAITHDGGLTWRFSRIEGQSAVAAFVGTHIVWVSSTSGSKTMTIQTGEKTISSTLGGSSWLPGNASGTFIDDQNGWFTFSPRWGGQLAALQRFTFAVSPEVDMFATTDGGKTFHVITPPGGASHPVIPPLQVMFVNGILVGGIESRFAPLRTTPPMLSAGTPVEIKGTGFLAENFVWVGSRKFEAGSKDGGKLLFLLPADLAVATYDLYVENDNGKSKTIRVRICERDTGLKISGLSEHDTDRDGTVLISAGQKIEVFGSGFLLENTIWFGTQSVPADVELSGGAVLGADVPASLAHGPCDVYVTNAAGKSNVLHVAVH